MSLEASEKGRATARFSIRYGEAEGCAAAAHGGGRLRNCWSVLQPYAVARRMPARTGQLGAAVAARPKPINHLWPLMDERCTSAGDV